MKTFRTIAIALTTAASMAAAAPALAGTDGPFTGGYVAAVGGWDRMQADHANRNGFAYGAQAGYDLASGNVRFGPEIEVTGSTQKGCDHNGNASYCADAGGTSSSAAGLGMSQPRRRSSTSPEVIPTRTTPARFPMA